MQADLQLKSADLSAAQSQLLQLKNGARPQEIQEAHAAVAAAQTQYDQAKKDWDRAQTLYKNDDISTSQYDQFRTRFDSRRGQPEAGERARGVGRGRAAQRDNRGRRRRRWSAPVPALRMGQANSIETKRREQDLVARGGRHRSAPSRRSR